MSNNIGNFHTSLEQIRDSLQSSIANPIRNILTDDMIENACREEGYTQYRKRLMTPIVTTLHYVLSAILPEESFQSCWSAMWNTVAGIHNGVAGHKPGSGTHADARKRLPVNVINRIWTMISATAQETSEPLAYWRGHRVVLMDGTTVSMPDNPLLTEEFGKSRGRYGLSRFPVARIVTLALASTMTVIDYAVGKYRDSETELLKKMFKSLRPNDLLLGDRHFAGANLYALYTVKNLEYVTRANQHLRIHRLERICTYNDNDFVVKMPILPIHRKSDPSLPEYIPVRIIRFRAKVRGKYETIWLATSLLSDTMYPAHEIVELYCRRWRIEMLFEELKVKLGADVLRSQTPDNIRKELAARFIALNVIRMLMTEAALKHGMDPLEISFIESIRAVVYFAPAFVYTPLRALWKLNMIYDAMLSEIAGNKLRIRPNRIEPRLVRRENVRYGYLRTSRREWRLTIVA